VRTYTSPGEVQIDPGDNTVAQLLQMADEQPKAGALAYEDEGRFVDVSTREMADTVADLAAGLIALGVEPGDRVALFCGTRMEFTLLDYAIWAAGCATVTIYETSSAEQVQWIVGDSGSVVLICETETMKGIYDEVAQSLPECREALVIDGGALDRLRSLAADETRAEAARRSAAISHDDLATLVYTSGTTGRPKGCVITHRNFTWTARQIEARLPELMAGDQRQLMFLPLAHIFARIVQVTCIAGGIKMGYSAGIPHLTEEFPVFRPTWIFAVPRVFEKIYNGAEQKAHADGKGAIFDRAANVAIDYSKGTDGGGPGLATRLQHALFDKLVYGKLRAVFGGDLVYAISGAAALGSRLGHFFRGIGLTPLEGYGLTETTAASTVNAPTGLRIGTVGRPLPGVSIRIADDGEILIKGGNIFPGYWKNEAATAAAIDSDGWFRSGDIGTLDDDGFLSITGRKKELIVTAAGKNVAPAVLEDRLRAHALVSQCLVIGDAKPFIAALVTIDEEALPSWAAANGKDESALSGLIDDPDLIGAVQAAIDDANKAVSRAESIRAFRILPRDLTIAGGELTPTLKVKRAVVAEEYAAMIDDIYG
jgi:long-chain acyl-CoA synthetase